MQSESRFPFDGGSKSFFLPPLRRISIIAPVFIQENNPIIFRSHEGSYMAGNCFIPGIYMYHRDDQISNLFHPLNLAGPAAGILAVCPYETPPL